MFLRILLVTANRQDAESVRAVLALLRSDARVELAENGDEALSLLFRTGLYSGRGAGEAPRLVLLDTDLTGMDGFDVLHRIRAHPETRRIPVVMLGITRDLAAITRAYELGANSFIVKPEALEPAAAGGALGYWAVHNVAPEI